MRVLVAAASRHGATQHIGQAIAETLTERGIDTDLRPAEQVDSLGGYDAVILGSAVYAGRWLKAGLRFVERHHEALAATPVWLFSSGPVGTPPQPQSDPVDVAALVEATAAEDHRNFPGRVDRDQLNLAEKAIVKLVRAEAGDFRDWDAVRQWATTIAGRLAISAA